MRGTGVWPWLEGPLETPFETGTFTVSIVVPDSYPLGRAVQVESAVNQCGKRLVATLETKRYDELLSSLPSDATCAPTAGAPQGVLRDQDLPPQRALQDGRDLPRHPQDHVAGRCKLKPVQPVVSALQGPAYQTTAVQTGSRAETATPCEDLHHSNHSCVSRQLS